MKIRQLISFVDMWRKESVIMKIESKLRHLGSSGYG